MSRAESAKIIPVTPPVINVDTRPIANIIAGVRTNDPFQRVVK